MSSFRTIAMLLPCLLGAPALYAQTETGQWSPVSEERPLAGVAGVRETVWSASRPPGGPYDTIELHRYRGEDTPRGALLYLPGTNMHGEVALADERYNLWLYLARRGFDVYALDYRTHAVPAEGVEDFRFMGAWSVREFVGDARAAAALARHESGLPRVFVAGFSRGVALAYCFAAAEPAGGLAGLIALDGMLKRYRPTASADFEALHEAFRDAGRFESDVAGGFGWERRQALMAAAAADPDARAETGDGTVGEQLASVLYGARLFPGAGLGGLANAVGGRSRPEVLARLLESYDRYYPALQNVEGQVLSDYDDAPYSAVDDGWGELSLPVIYFGCTRLGTDWLLNGIHSAARSGSEDVTIHVLEDHGHLDVIAGNRSAELVFEPLLAWMLERAAPAAGAGASSRP